MRNRNTSRGSKKPLDSSAGLLCLLIAVVSGMTGRSGPRLQRQGGGGQAALPTWTASPSSRGSERLLLAGWVRCAASCGRWNPWRPLGWPGPSWKGKLGVVRRRERAVPGSAEFRTAENPLPGSAVDPAAPAPPCSAFLLETGPPQHGRYQMNCQRSAVSKSAEVT